MEASIVAAVGSFVVSEKVIKFKAYIILGLSCTIIYDLSKYTNDPVSLRVYRGPALLALTLLSLAFCLRTWRRNGVACDELLFLPGSIYAKIHSSNNSSYASAYRRKRLANRLPLNLRNVHGYDENVERGNIHISDSANTPGNGASGLEEAENMNMMPIALSYELSPISKNSDVNEEEPMMEMVPLTTSTIDSNNLDGEGDPKDGIGESGPTPEGIDTGHCTASVNVNASSNSISGKLSLWRHIACRSNKFLLRRSTSSSTAESRNSLTPTINTINPTSPSHQRSSSGGVGGFIARFFSSYKESNEYAPSGPAVASASLDLCMPVLFNLHLFIMATHFVPEETKESTNSADSLDPTDTQEKPSSSIPPQVLPLLFLSILYIRAVLPPKSRRRFWGTIKSAILSPFVGVTFRDELIAEVATSLVRPMQDFNFALFYYFSSIYFIIFGKVDLQNIGHAIEQSMLLHNFLLPICAIFPIFCRFLQTLRQAFDDQQRWPHLGNALKYLTSSLVIIYGLTHAEKGRSVWWYLGFVVCVIYQIWWDVFIDWELLVSSPDRGSQIDHASCIDNNNDAADDDPINELQTAESSAGGISFTSNHWFSRYFYRMDLRPQQLYKSKKMYWHILIFNACIRFCWILAFIPAYHWNTRTGSMEETSSVDTKQVMGFLVSISELLRRCLWVILRLELETIKLTDREYTSICSNPYHMSSNNIYTDGSVSGGWNNQVQYTCLMPRGESASSTNNQTMAMKWTAYRLLSKKLFCLELFLWVVVYLGLGLWVCIN